MWKDRRQERVGSYRSYLAVGSVVDLVDAAAGCTEEHVEQSAQHWRPVESALHRLFQTQSMRIYLIYIRNIQIVTAISFFSAMTFLLALGLTANFRPSGRASAGSANWTTTRSTRHQPTLSWRILQFDSNLLQLNSNWINYLNNFYQSWSKLIRARQSDSIPRHLSRFRHPPFTALCHPIVFSATYLPLQNIKECCGMGRDRKYRSNANCKTDERSRSPFDSNNNNNSNYTFPTRFNDTFDWGGIQPEVQTQSRYVNWAARWAWHTFIRIEDLINHPAIS